MDKKINLASLAFFILFLFCFEQNEASFESKHFVLVHGSGHGAWCWYKVTKLLRSSGHRVTALDLAASGIDLLQAKSLKSISEYFKPLRDVMEGLASHERVILVGHSLGGLALSHVMEKFPEKIAIAVFVTALMPGPELNVSTLNQESLRRSPPVLDSHYTYDNGPNNPPTTFSFGPIYLASTVYQLSPIEDLTLASTLLRPLRLFCDEDMSRQITLSRENYGSVRRIFVLSEEDKLVPKDLAEWMIKRKIFFFSIGTATTTRMKTFNCATQHANQKQREECCSIQESAVASSNSIRNRPQAIIKGQTVEPLELQVT